MTNISIELFEDDVEVSQETYDHVHQMISEGYTSGEVCQSSNDDDYVSGWWSLSAA